MGTAPRLLLIAAVAMMLPVGHAAAQTMPWPGDPQPPGGGPAWPGERAGPPGMSPMMGAPPSRPMGGGAGGMPPCMAEFTKLRDDVEKKGMVAKEAGQHKVSREEMCKYVTTYSAAEEKWVKFTVSNVQSCGIPAQVADQLKKVHSNTEQTKQKLCAAGPSAAAPTLSDVLTAPSTPSTEAKKGGTFDTLIK
jgi:hypothetical protein